MKCNFLGINVFPIDLRNICNNKKIKIKLVQPEAATISHSSPGPQQSLTGTCLEGLVLGQ